MIDLIASYWTLAGNARLRMRGGTDYSPLDLRMRIETAAATGFRGIGFHSADLVHWSSRYPYTDVARMVADHGLDYVELEILREWFVTDERRAESDRVRRELLDVAAAISVGHVKIGSSLGDDVWPVAHVAEEYARLCAQFADVGTRVALEPVAVASVRTPEQALAVVDAAAAPNGGIILDTWHAVRANVPYESLRTIPAERILSVELTDGAAEPIGGLASDGCDHRMLCGEGDFRVADFAEAVLDTNYRGRMGVENLSETNRRRPLEVAAKTNFDSATTVLSHADGAAR